MHLIDKKKHIVVEKFGGTSVADVSCITRAASIVKHSMRDGRFPVVVISAMAGVTNQLIEWTRETGGGDMSEYDSVISSGEQVTAGLMALSLRKQGLKARSWTGWQVPINTNDVHGKAEITSINTEKIMEDIKNGIIPVIAGFQGVDENGRVSTLGRGGSDITATAVSAFLGARLCEIYTDVDGVYTADPRWVTSARKFDVLSYDDMVTLAEYGAKVLHPRAVAWAKKYNIPMKVLSSFHGAIPASGGTLITNTKNQISCGITQRQAVKWVIENTDESIACKINVMMKENEVPQVWREHVGETLEFLTWKTDSASTDLIIKESGIQKYKTYDVMLIALVGNDVVKSIFSAKEIFADDIPMRGFFKSLLMTGIIVDHKHLSAALNRLHDVIHSQEIL